MKGNKAKKTIQSDRLSDKELLSLVASKLKGRSLFPEKVADAKEHIRQLKADSLK
jgi:hypothetical protein